MVTQKTMGATSRLVRDFLPRGQFECPRKVLNWYPGYQEKTINQLKRHQSQMDIIIEVRDARVPFSSVNPDIEATFGKQKRLIVFTKCDLVQKHALEVDAKD
jgi:ribosome biogenesis GTPase A